MHAAWVAPRYPVPRTVSRTDATVSGTTLAPVMEQVTVTGVSVVMPVLNESRHLEAAVAAVFAQDWAGPLELVIALGPSSDDTDAIAARLQQVDPRITLVANPSGRTARALNAAIAASRYSVIVRVDGHAELASDYVRVAVETLQATGADNVGGIMAASGRTPFERAVARAMTSPLGVGSAAFHVGGQAGPAETVYLGVFRRSALERVGGFDEQFIRAQDWELNHRIRSSGGLVWFTPDLMVTYRPRSTVSALARQYAEYGRWRHAVMRRHPETRWTWSALRYYAPPAAVLGVVSGTLASAVSVVAGGPWLWGALLPVGYLLGVSVGGLALGRADHRVAARLPLVLATMHLAWGWGFLTSPRHLR